MKEQLDDDQEEPKVTRQIASEAATWIAALHGPSRSPQMERDCREWLARSAAHRLAFEKTTDVWQEVAGLKVADVFAALTPGVVNFDTERRIKQRVRSRWLVATAVTVLLATGAWAAYRWLKGEGYVTQVGEQHQVILSDGTRMSLNTNTQVRVKMNADSRAVHVEKGEALFDVAKDASKPFVVHVAGNEVVALGTVFSVRMGEGGADDSQTRAIAVTLIEGKVTVRPDGLERSKGIAPAMPVSMQPGERMRITGGSVGAVTQLVDRPSMEQVVAWTHNEAVFDDMALPEAVAEMNRYSRTPIVLAGDAAIERLRVSGLYRTGESASFARSVANLHGLQLREQAGRLELALSPQNKP